ncbi:hypothetical protein [Dyella sp. C11]|uniref:hypothetical protein n=1 Tax=Dyella sp. C11 TaxID=2126991 RepID=UPI000D646FD0|nr:hypothetical protein [Dyella sp. C11]
MIISKEVVESDAVAVSVGMFAFAYAQHLPSIMVAIGACAGFSAQLAVWKTLVQPADRDPGDFLCNARTKAGEAFVMGDAINQFLWATLPDRLSFLSTAAGGLGDASELPDLAELARYVIQTMGNETFGVPRYPRPGEYAELPRIALKKVFPNVVRQFERDGHPVAHWPALLGLIAWRIMNAKQNELKSAHAIAMLMESAVPMSRIDPSTMDTPRFDIDWKLGQRWGGRAMTSDTGQRAQLFADIHAALPSNLEQSARPA